MKDRSTLRDISPLRLLVFTIVLIALVETFMILVVVTLPHFPDFKEELVTALVSLIILVPTIYLLLVRPLVHEIQRRKAAEMDLQAAQEELENRVLDRTAELALANALLEEEVEYHQQVKAILERERGELEQRVQDRTRELREEVELHQQVSNRLRLQTTALESAANGVIITNRQGVIEWGNQAFFEMTGYSPEEALGKTPGQMKSGLYGESFYSRFWETILSGQVWRGELTNRRKDGTLYVEEQTVTPVPDESGQITHFIAIKQDITERKRAEDVIRAEAARAEIRAAFVEALSEASPDFDKVLNVTAQRMADLIGDICVIHIQAPDGEALNVAACYHSRLKLDVPEGKDLEGVARSIGADLARFALASGRPYMYPAQAPGEVGPLFIEDPKSLGACSGIALPLYNQAQRMGAISLFRDCGSFPYTPADLITLEDLAERVSLALVHARLYQDLGKALQQEQTMRAQLVQTEKFAAIGRMVASVAHELNNPLQTIKNCLYLVEQDATTDTSREFLRMASSEIQRLARLVEQLREVYRPRSPNMMAPFDLGKLLDEVHLFMLPYLERNRVHWEPARVTHPITVLGSVDQIKQVFLNISLNAIDAMQPDGGQIQVSIAYSSNEDQVGIVFRDSGPGIDPEHLPHIFEPLFTTKEQGLGLGLPISYDIVQKHGGHIEVESPPGQGTAFTVWLPRVLDEAPVRSKEVA